MTAPTCRPVDNGPDAPPDTRHTYLVIGEHYDECDKGDDCPGCWPCVPRTDNGVPLTHCTARGRCTEHVPEGTLTCPRCLGKTRTTLTDIEREYALMPEEAIEKGVDSEAANLAGPADPVGWATRPIRGSGADFEVTLEDHDPHHPLLVLGRWELQVRDHYGHDAPPPGITVTSTVAYLLGQLDRFAQDPGFRRFVRETNACRAHLEAVLHDQRGPETGAPCPKCSTTEKKGPALHLQHHDRDRSGASDVWVCPECKSRWTVAEYRQRVGTDYVRHAPTLTLTDMAARVGIPSGTLRRWASRRRMQLPGESPIELPPLLMPAGRSEDGRKTYRVSDVEALRDGVCRLDVSESA